ncbi:hypothetical protein QJS10_CPA08g00796 [Acorus calamus]|uniref:Uncharacterized protein n=1 Tax=Acorus calamus TaxID=4465 RepID=A0AAV9EDT9_ACOCL|nr:hypothetical protein QJS10_CPA08g00865 [Acorus calamus]KAK1311244.1 hypothetical protein QJS10_CPA08g00806 [Acorus calamus]KAK1311489.1 hypothetical protein QJS10_CPA08g00820 [Acorus calamus]KAK1311522.1 hypothetical protein QJS10_CPA08g00796 [Acorus calamus]
MGRICATRSWISVDRGSKVTLPLTMLRRLFKSSAKDSARRSVGIALHGDHEKSRHRRIKKQRRYERLAATSQLSLCRIPLVRTSSESAVRRPRKAPPVGGAVPNPSPSQHAATRSRHGCSSSSPPAADGFRIGTPVPSPQSQSFSRGYGSILPTSLAYIVPSARGCSPWRPDAVMSTTGRGRHSVLRIFTGRRGRTGHHATCGALPTTGPYLRLSRFQGRQIRTDGRSARAHARGFAAAVAPSYSSVHGNRPDGRVWVARLSAIHFRG